MNTRNHNGSRALSIDRRSSGEKPSTSTLATGGSANPDRLCLSGIASLVLIFAVLVVAASIDSGVGKESIKAGNAAYGVTQQTQPKGAPSV